MLESLREAKSNFFLQVIIVVIVLSFVFFVGLSSLNTDTVVVVAEVNNERVTDTQYNRALKNQIERYRQLTGQSIPPEMEDIIREQVRDQVITETLLRQEAKKIGLQVSDRELLTWIMDGIPELRDESGKFNREYYQQILKTNPGFERTQRSILLANKMRQTVADAVEVSDTELRGIFLEEQAQVNLSFVRVPQFNFERSVTVTQAEVDDAIANKMDDIKARYDRDKSRKYDLPKKVRARHILKSLDADADEETVAAVLGEMETILAEAKANNTPEAFAELAKAHSDDPGSAARGGDLGFFDEKRMVPEFSAAAFAMEPGEISELVKSNFGYHIIRVEEIQDPKVTPLSEAQEEIARAIIKETKGAEAAKAFASQVQDAWRKGEDVAPLLEGQTLTVQETALFARSTGRIPKLGGGSDAMEIAFGLEMDAPVPAAPVEIPGGFAAMKLIEKKSANPAEFDSAKADLRDRILNQRRQQVMEAYIDDIKANADIILPPSA